MVHVAVALVLLIVILVVCYLYDKITVGGNGIWYGYEEPPEWFVGFWDKGDVVVQWPRPSTVEDLVFEGLTEEDLVVSGRPIYDDIVVGELHADKIAANSVTYDFREL